MEDLEVELNRIDSRLVQYARRLDDGIASVAALKTLSAKQLQEDHHRGLQPQNLLTSHKVSNPTVPPVYSI